MLAKSVVLPIPRRSLCKFCSTDTLAPDCAVERVKTPSKEFAYNTTETQIFEKFASAGF
jgi:hypothetical protein